MEEKGRLEKILNNGYFAVTGELGPPRGNDVESVREKAECLRGCTDAVNVTDNQTAVVRMSSIAASALLVNMGLEPVMQMVTRDRNRIAMQSDLLGASALGIRNLLCLSGDHQTFGNQPGAKNVHDIDSMQLINAVKGIRDGKKLMDSDEEISGELNMFIGAAAAPFSDPVEFRPLRLKKKIDAGADFIQTQCIYDIEAFRVYMQRACDLGLDSRCSILAGVMPLKSAGMARYMAANVPGVTIPDAIIKRMENAPSGKAGEEGIRICCEQIQQLREVNGVKGIHVMAVEWEHRIEEILDNSGLLPRPLI